MDNFRTILRLIIDIAPNIALAVFVWGAIDNYFLTRYGGKLDRGFTVWKKSLTDNDKQFLLSLKEDIVDKKQVRLWRTKISFIVVRDREALIRYSNPGQNTSWPMICYVDLSSSEPMLEYRLSLPMLLGTIILSFFHIIVFLILSVAFVISWLFETGGARNYLSQKADLYLVRQTSLK